MDSVSEIKARLPIEELVARYCQLTKKGRNFVALCPFHNDTHPSFLVSPDKGIAYCFACQSGGDVFSFYQKIEGVDFVTALKDLAERAGVKLEQRAGAPAVKKDERDRARECLEAALRFYREQFKVSKEAQEYIAKRGVPAELIEKFEIGVAPDSFSATYEYLLKAGFSRKEILAAGLGVQRELKDERIYDRFRHRLMFPIRDGQGLLIGFGGRTLGTDDAKYVNTAETMLYHKSNVLYGLHAAKEAMREKKHVVLVEGYFDVIACHRSGVENAVAVSGTALTEQHGKILKRLCESVTLCLDQDCAGQEAAERSYDLLTREGLAVLAVRLPKKDPDEVAQENPEMLKALLGQRVPYIDHVLADLHAENISSPLEKRKMLERLLRLIAASPSAVERRDYLGKIGGLFGTTETALEEDLRSLEQRERTPALLPRSESEEKRAEGFSKSEIALALFLLYPKFRNLLTEMIPPEEGWTQKLYSALKAVPDEQQFTFQTLELEPEVRERAMILLLFAEQHGFGEWSESLALRELRKSCRIANREILLVKQRDITERLLAAKNGGHREQVLELETQYQHVLKLANMVS